MCKSLDQIESIEKHIESRQVKAIKNLYIVKENVNTCKYIEVLLSSLIA